MISVCIATYNGEKYIKEQIESILPQLNENDEIIVSDDGSDDRTLDILSSINDSRILIYNNKDNHGVNGNFSNALAHSHGDYIFLADQDDIWMPDKAKTCIDALQNADLIVHDAIITNNLLVSSNKSLFSELNIKEGFIPNFIRNRFTGCCMAFRKEVLDYILPIPDSCAFFHDQWIGLKCILKGKVKFIPYKGIFFRRHEDTNSFAGTGKGLPVIKKLTSRISLIFRLFAPFSNE